ncbi:DUF4176 domain-containing protein [Allobaculum stercoricanis]|uniref:DUF4176 domain-containing protein n=1 Tax=Allobaculum stercoricanis TaxID=174709 RepID=UPI00248D6349|nr:DUF4176 domain-containing protein [Allobaculum stercoricanis]
MKDFLPLGTIVTLKGGSKRVMIVGRLQQETNNQMIYDYSAVCWPEGMIDSKQVYLFNHEDLAMIWFIGYQDQEEFEVRASLERECSKLNRQSTSL